MTESKNYIPNHADRRRFQFSLTRTTVIAIICSSIFVLTHRVYSFPVFLASDHQRSRTEGRSILSNSRSTPKEGNAEYSDEIEEAIELGRSELGKYYDFPLDDWQLQAGGDILNGHNVIVCAPTGSGKTVVGEMALHTAFDRDLDGIYTTPLKALSNQKYTDFRQLFGRDNVGLSTGDVSINREKARLTVMTTEVYRNIAWRSSAQSSEIDSLNSQDEENMVSKNNSGNNLRKNAMVVLDEFHYMGQPGRGGVWEECVITSPAHTQIIGLSATLPNALELAKWMESVTGRSTILIEAPGARPVPLKYLFATREGLFPLFRNEDAGPGSPLGLLGYRERLTRREMRKAVPSLMILLTRLKEKNLLPAIFFIFSRKGCDETAENLCNGFKGPLNPNIDLENDENLQKSVAQFNDENPEIAFTDDVVEQLMFGLGRHHAGMLPAHKMLIENLFRNNLMKAVFATETLSAGINMPARTTVICSLAKRGDSGMVLLETSNLLQMAGRAGRRGFDEKGTCVLVATPFEGEDIAATLLTNPVKPITSQFRPSYALTVNLIARGNGSLSIAKQLVSKSFANW
ncbi:P-loop containing nucleoside triphosphate hydrolase protein, partial [Fragilariopsis cylindrus CCMP1102]